MITRLLESPPNSPSRRTRCEGHDRGNHGDKTDRLGVKLKTSHGFSVHKDVREECVKSLLGEGVKRVQHHTNQHITITQNAPNVGIFLILQEELLARIITFQRILAKNSAHFSLFMTKQMICSYPPLSYLHLFLIAASSLHFLLGQRLLCEEEIGNEGDEECKSSNCEGNQERELMFILFNSKRKGR